MKNDGVKENKIEKIDELTKMRNENKKKITERSNE